MEIFFYFQKSLMFRILLRNYSRLTHFNSQISQMPSGLLIFFNSRPKTSLTTLPPDKGSFDVPYILIFQKAL